VTTNSVGLRDVEHALSKPPGTYRIVVLGDSLSEAIQVDREKTFWAELQRELEPCPDRKGRKQDRRSSSGDRDPARRRGARARFFAEIGASDLSALDTKLTDLSGKQGIDLLPLGPSMLERSRRREKKAPAEVLSASRQSPFPNAGKLRYR
jgi:hypothetical protein